MKLIAFIALLTALCPLLAAADSKTATDPFAGAFFPPELVLLARDRIALTPEQQQAFRARVEKTQSRSDELRAKLERETATLATLAKQERVDEASLLAQLDKVLDVERELKHLHVGLVVAIKNLLTPEQQAKLREIAKDGGAQLIEATRKRLTEKVERVKQGAQKWAASGRDPSAIAQDDGREGQAFARRRQGHRSRGRTGSRARTPQSGWEMRVCCAGDVTAFTGRTARCRLTRTWHEERLSHQVNPFSGILRRDRFLGATTDQLAHVGHTDLGRQGGVSLGSRRSRVERRGLQSVA